MKRHGNLFDKIVDKDNIRLAHKNARKGKTFYAEVQKIDADIDRYVNEIHNMLVEGTYTVSEYKMFTKNDKGKIREIYKLDYYPDRIIHHAILQVLEPIWKPMLINSTYQSIKGRGVKACKRNVEKCIKEHKDTELWVLKLDIKKFYPSVNNEILKFIISKKIKCKKTLELLYRIIDSMRGLPIGNYISQYLGNMYLMYLDQLIKSLPTTVGYFRYCDDIIVFSNSKDNIKEICVIITKYLERELKLSVKKNVQYFSLNKRPLDFVGYVFMSNGKVRLRSSIVKRMKNTLAENKTESVSAYYGWVLESKAFGLWNKHYKGYKYGNKKSNWR